MKGSLELWGLPLGELARLLAADTLPAALLNPGTAPLFLLVLGLVAFQYARIGQMEARLYGRPLVPLWHRVLTAIAAGLLGGFIGGLVITAAGVVLEPRDVTPLWPVALGLALIRPRFLCFAYATGLIGASHLLLGWPQVHVPGLVALVGALHLAEAVLVYVDGAEGATPVLARNGRGEVVGGFLLQRFWPVPAAILVLVNLTAPGGGIEMPSWWPLVGPADPARLNAAGWIVVALPLVAGLGYSDLALTATPGTRSRQTALVMVLYSAALVAMAALAERDARWLWPAVLASPLLHEGMIQLGIARERWGRPLFGPPAQGARVLWVWPRSPAAALGLQAGDVILTANGRPVRRESDLRAVSMDLWEGPLRVFDLELEIQRGNRRLTRRLQRFDPGAPFGALLVPPPGDPVSPLIDLGRGKHLFGA
ncbi:PDZ domain-containing protein [Thermaerobacter sp. PB12/4term]|uniref:PDZ domain-containing protein n=1 Tax=Thermaerobacter sp. PB12/4term TaxID=2293838 RepID=UPI000E32710B|nr:PDZ domain-containing protein [Thermaerobacter sp. PB12/4term]QIA26267.1 PDZ domain-containing protein [Thermaerobacter sp. PB12/4term]